QVFIDPNDYRGDIEAAVEDATGRQLMIRGDLSLQTFPCCGVSLGPLQLSNPEGFLSREDKGHFAKVENAAVSVRLLPLILSQEIAIGDVELDGLDLVLISRKDGAVNWEFAEGAAPEAVEDLPAEEASAGGAPVDLAVAGIYVTDGRMMYIDEATGDEIEVSGITITTSEISGSDSFNFSAGLQVAGLAPDILLKLGVDSGAVLDLDAGSVELQGLNVDVDVAGLAINLQGDGLVGGDVQKLQGQFSIAEFSPQEILKALGEPPMVTADPAVLSKASIQSGWSLDGDAARLDGLRIVLDDTTISGAVDVQSIEQQQLGFDIQIDSIDVDRYSEPVPAETAAGSGAGSAETATTGDEPLDLPVEDMRALNMQGSIGIGSLRAADTLLTNVDMSIAAKDGLIQLDPVNADIYGGKTSATVDVDVRGDVPAFRVDETLDSFQIGEYLKDTADNENVVGAMNVKLSVNTKGNSTNELTRALKGDASLSMQNAKYLGIDLWHEIRAARAKIKGEAAPAAPAEPYTDISEVSASLQFNNGIATNNDLVARIPLLSLGGKGTVDMLSTDLNYRLEAKVTGEKQFEDGYEIDDFNGVTIPVKLTGPAEDPSIRVELDKVLADLAKKKAEDRIMKKLGLDEEDGDETEDTKEKLKRGLRGLFD
ncbi:MAG: AsmA family protein, partial [Gammaproteobacteria bacterium]